MILASVLPSISIVIPTYNSERTLTQCLESIARQDYPREKIEIIVADGGSKDKTLEIAKKFEVDKMLRNSLRTGEAGKAVGVEAARNEIAAFIDNSFKMIILIESFVMVVMMLTRDVLVSIKRKALRKRVWFRVLNREERGIFSLTIRCVERIRSVKLAKIVKAIVDKLEGAVKGRVERLMETVGRQLARKLSEIAEGWGNESAESWAGDRGFTRFLAVSYMNTPGLYNVYSSRS
jgi:glycosyltransferase involved in cell wall biosynthesis